MKERSWVRKALDGLRAGRVVEVRPSGESMRGRIESGQAVTIAPATHAEVAPGDVVLVGWKGNYLLHLVLKVEGGRVQIGNNVGKINGWVSGDAVLGKVIT